jgi:TraR antiactivator
MSDIDFDPFEHLFGNQPKELVELLVIDEIKKHRQLISEGELLYDKMRRSNEDPAAEAAYLAQMVGLLGQQMALSKLLDILGYIPDVPITTSH